MSLLYFSPLPFFFEKVVNKSTAPPTMTVTIALNPTTTTTTAASSSSASTSIACCSDQTPIRNAPVLHVSRKSPNPISLVSSNHRRNPLLRLCRASLGRRDGDVIDYGDDQYLQASLLVSGPFLDFPPFVKSSIN